MIFRSKIVDLIQYISFLDVGCESVALEQVVESGQGDGEAAHHVVHAHKANRPFEEEAQKCGSALRLFGKGIQVSLGFCCC